MKEANGGRFEMDIIGLKKTLRFLAVVGLGSAATAILSGLVTNVLPNLKVEENYQWLIPVAVTLLSGLLEALRRFMTDYSKRA